jgi:hypothetical protein
MHAMEECDQGHSVSTTEDFLDRAGLRCARTVFRMLMFRKSAEYLFTSLWQSYRSHPLRVLSPRHALSGSEYRVAADVAGTGELHHFRSSPTGSIIPAAVAALCNLCLFFGIYN